VTPETALKKLEAARAVDEYVYAEAVAEVLDRAYRLRWLPWRRPRSIQLFQVVADLDIDDKVIAAGVDEARRYLERRGIPCEPSAQSSGEERVASTPPFEMHIMYAKRAMQEAASGGSRRKRRKALHDALAHYDQAAKHGELSRRHQGIVAGLQQRLGK
jgi:hypothetical protein